MKILFAGTPALALPSLSLLAQQHEIVGVLTSPDRRSGRSSALVPSEVKRLAGELGLRVCDPERLDDDVFAQIKESGPELLVVVAYGVIFKKEFLDLFPKGAVNLHPSLLPLHRGPSPLNATLLSGDARWGISVQRLALKMDAGDILLQQAWDLSGTEDTPRLYELAAERGALMLAEVLSRYGEALKNAKAQDFEKASYCRLIKKEDGLIEWAQSAQSIERRVRAMKPWPRAYTFLDGQMLFIDQARVISAIGAGPEPGKVLGMDKKDGILLQTGEGQLSITKLQLQSKKPMDHISFFNGFRSLIGTVLGGRS